MMPTYEEQLNIEIFLGEIIEEKIDQGKINNQNELLMFCGELANIIESLADDYIEEMDWWD